MISWLLPNHYYPWGTAWQELTSFLACLMFLFALVWGRSASFSLYFLWLFFLPVIPLLQYAVGRIFFVNDAVVPAFYLCGFAWMLVVGYSFCQKKDFKLSFVSLLAGSVVLASMISVWIALRQWLLFPENIWTADLPFGGRPFANLGQPNNLAILLCLGLSGVFYFYEKNKLGRFSSALLVGFILFGVVLTQSRTPWVFCFLALCAFYIKRRHCSMRLSGMAVFLGVFIYFLGVVFLSAFCDLLLLPVTHLAERAGSFERLSLWGQLLHAVSVAPFWGYGWNQVAVAQVAVAVSYPVPIVTEHAHNIFIDLLLWNGVLVGGIISAFILYSLLWAFFKIRTIEGMFSFLGVGFLFVHSLLEFPLDYAFFLLWFGLLLGVVFSELIEPSRKLGLNFFVFLSFVLGCLFQVWIWREYKLIEDDYRLMRFEVLRIGALKALEPAPNVIILAQPREYLRLARTELASSMTDEKILLLRRMAQRTPYPWIIFRYAAALAVRGEYVEGRVQLEILKSLYGEGVYDESLRELGRLAKDEPAYLKLLSDG